MTDTDPQRQLSRYLAFLEHDPQNSALLCDIAVLQFSLAQFAAARASAQQTVALAPDKLQAHTVLGLIAARESDYSQAATHLSRALALGETAPVAFYNHAYALAMLGRYEEAEASAAIAAQAVDELPHAPALYLRVLHYLDKIDAAIDYAEGLRAAGKTAPRVNGMLSTLYLDNADLEKARIAAAAALGEDPGDTDARATMGVVALGELDARLALAQFEQVLNKQPNHGRALLGRGLGQMLEGDLNTACSTLELATRGTNMSGHIGSWHTLAWCHILQKNIEGAEHALQQALELDRNFSETHGGLAVVALMRGNLDAAVQAAKRAHGLDRNNFSGNFAQSLIQQVSGNAAQARAIVEGLLSQPLLPGGKTVQMAVAEMLARSEGGNRTAK